MLEKIFYYHLDGLITKQKLLRLHELGFCPDMSTCQALVDIIKKISQSLDARKNAVSVFIYLKKHLIRFITNYYVKKWNFLVPAMLRVNG